jgi:hypothetical protein
MRERGGCVAIGVRGVCPAETAPEYRRYANDICRVNQPELRATP